MCYTLQKSYDSTQQVAHEPKFQVIIVSSLISKRLIVIYSTEKWQISATHVFHVSKVTGCFSTMMLR